MSIESPKPKTAPYGYSLENDTLIINQQELVIRKEIFEAFNDCQRKETTARIINEKGYRTRNGVEFSDVIISRILQAPQIEIPMSESENSASFVSEKLYEKVQEILSVKKPPSRIPVHPFSGKVICGFCDNKMRILSSIPNKFTCKKCRRKIERNDLENVYQSQLKELNISSKMLSSFDTKSQSNNRQLQEQLSVLTTEQATATKQRKRNHQLYIQEKIDIAQFEDIDVPLQKSSQQLKKSITDIKKQMDVFQENTQNTKPQKTQTLFERWNELSASEKIQFIESSTERIVVLGQEIEITFYFLPSLSINDGNIPTAEPQPKTSKAATKPIVPERKNIHSKTTKKERRIPMVKQAIKELFGEITSPDTLTIGDGEVNRIFQRCKKLERDSPKKEQVFNIAFSTFLRTQGYWSYIKSHLPYDVVEIPPRKRK